MKELSELTLEIQKVLQTHDKKKVNKLFSAYQDVDIASALNELEDEAEIVATFELINKKYQTTLFTYLNLETQELLVKNLNNNDLKLLVNNIYSDDLVDLIDDLRKDDVKKVLNLATAEKRLELNDILQHDEQTAGGIMSVNLLKLSQTLTVSEAIKAVQAVHDKVENVDDLFIIDDFEALVGQIQLKDLLFNDSEAKLESIMNTAVVSTRIDRDQEEVAQVFKRYDLNSLPVVTPDNKLAGVIAIDDVVDVIERETTEDLQRFAGITPFNDDDPFKQKIGGMFLSRLIWLGGGMLLATIVQILLVVFFNKYGLNHTQLGTINDSKYAVIYLYAPLVFVLMAVCGVSVSQSTSNVVRALSINDDQKKLRRLVFKEMLTTLIVGGVMIVLNILRLVIFYAIQFNSVKGQGLWDVVLTSSVTLILGILLSGLLGSLLPIGAKKLKRDPSLVSSPLMIGIITVVVCAIFFGLGLAFY